MDLSKVAYEYILQKQNLKRRRSMKFAECLLQDFHKSCNLPINERNYEKK